MPAAVRERRTMSRGIRRRQYSCRAVRTSAVSMDGRRERALAAVSPGALLLAAAIPVLFLHVAYQPGFGVRLGGTTVDAYLSDFAVLAVVVAAVVQGVRAGFGPLMHARRLWIAGVLLFAWIFA